MSVRSQTTSHFRVKIIRYLLNIVYIVYDFHSNFVISHFRYKFTRFMDFWINRNVYYMIINYIQIIMFWILGADDHPLSQLPKEKPPQVSVSSKPLAQLPKILPYPPSVLLHNHHSLSFPGFSVFLYIPVKYDPLSRSCNMKLRGGNWPYEFHLRTSC